MKIMISIVLLSLVTAPVSEEKEFNIFKLVVCENIYNGDVKTLDYYINRYVSSVVLHRKSADKSPIDVLNDLKSILVCPTPNLYYMKFAILVKRHNELFKDYFIDMLGHGKNDQKVDVNVIINDNKGNPETVLDYLDGIITANKDKLEYANELRRFRQFLVDNFNAKKYFELKKAKE